MENRKIIGICVEGCPLLGQVQTTSQGARTFASCAVCPWYLGRVWEGNDRMVICAWRHNKDKNPTRNDWLDGFVKNKK